MPDGNSSNVVRWLLRVLSVALANRNPQRGADCSQPKLEWVAGADLNANMECRSQCGACCIAPSISSPIPGMPHGKPAGLPCVHLFPDYRCALFGKPERPAVCVSLRPTETMCGANREEALGYLKSLEEATRPR
jgi:hypothetical protein